MPSGLDIRPGPGEAWAVFGPRGAGKSGLLASLAGKGGLVSLEEQARLIARERQRDDSDLSGGFFPGTPVRELLAETGAPPARQQALAAALGLTGLLERGFRKLSTGETRRLLLARAFASSASCLALDEPFAGLDRQGAAQLRALLAAEAEAGKRTLLLALNRIDDLPDFVDQVVYLEAGRVRHSFACTDTPPAEVRQRLGQLVHLSAGDLPLPPPEAPMAPRLNPDGSLARLRQGRVAYADQVVFEGLDWQIFPGEHWQVTGPNGSGKTCLLGLITGDHPQCYANDLCVFGYPRGQGETIWDIKRRLGHVSTALHWDYRLNVSVRQVILSGFHDSIGLYQEPTQTQEDLAGQWLALLGMADKASESFARLSYGEQRLLLIARALVKRPPLLLLDEPCLGLDEQGRQLALALVTRIIEAGGATVVYVAHHQEERIPAITRELALGG